MPPLAAPIIRVHAPSTLPEDNPYTSPAAVDKSSSPPLRWRLIPSIFCWLLGIGALFGYFASFVFRWLRPSVGPMESIEFLAIVLGVFGGLGWIIAGVMFWRRRWSVAFLAVLTAIALGTVGTMIADRM